MEQTLIKHPRLTVHVSTGSEGPSHDPYGYTETTVTTPKGKTVLHQGLVEWLEHDDQRIDAPTWFNKLSISIRDKVEHEWHRSVFKTYTGYFPEQLERISNKLNSRCRKCGGHEFRSESGYPGEHFEVCAKCGHVQSTYFCESEII